MFKTSSSFSWILWFSSSTSWCRSSVRTSTMLKGMNWLTLTCDWRVYLSPFWLCLILGGRYVDTNLFLKAFSYIWSWVNFKSCLSSISCLISSTNFYLCFSLSWYFFVFLCLIFLFLLKGCIRKSWIGTPCSFISSLPKSMDSVRFLILVLPSKMKFRSKINSRTFEMATALKQNSDFWRMEYIPMLSPFSKTSSWQTSPFLFCISIWTLPLMMKCIYSHRENIEINCCPGQTCSVLIWYCISSKKIWSLSSSSYVSKYSICFSIFILNCLNPSL